MTVTTTHQLPMILAEIEVVLVEQLTPTFVRVVFDGAALADLGVASKFYDQRIKLIFPNDAGNLPSFEGADESWFTTWMDIPPAERGHMRTYTIREVRGCGGETRIVVDFVIHLGAGTTGPGSVWAAAAKVGDRLIILAPRKGVDFGGIEFDPGAATNLLLIGDETAVPAISSILEDLPATTLGTVFCEVPVSTDIVDLGVPHGVEVVWLPRNGQERGVPTIVAVREHFGLAPTLELAPTEAVDPDLWETPTYSSSGEEIGQRVGEATLAEYDLAGIYAWIAGESRVVTTLRRALVKELEVDRRQVCFMGYWREGVAMRS